jgi:hypothetical protein
MRKKNTYDHPFVFCMPLAHCEYAKIILAGSWVNGFYPEPQAEGS